MRTLDYDELRSAGRKAMARAYLRGDMTERDRLRTAPRDPAKLECLRLMASARIRRNPIRRNDDGTYTVPAVFE